MDSISQPDPIRSLSLVRPLSAHGNNVSESRKVITSGTKAFFKEILLCLVKEVK